MENIELLLSVNNPDQPRAVHRLMVNRLTAKILLNRLILV
jgi:hypothetical protein